MRNKTLVVFTIFLLTLIIVGMGSDEQPKEQLAPLETVEEIHSNPIFINSNEILEKTILNSRLKGAD